MTLHFAYWTLTILGCIGINSTTFGGALYVIRVGGFTIDTLVYCDATSQHFLHCEIHGPVTTCSCGPRAPYLPSLMELLLNSTRTFSLLIIQSSTNDSHCVTMDLYFPHYDVGVHQIWYLQPLHCQGQLEPLFLPSMDEYVTIDISLYDVSLL
jgi:hypothetical protein